MLTYTFTGLTYQNVRRGAGPAFKAVKALPRFSPRRVYFRLGDWACIDPAGTLWVLTTLGRLVKTG